MLSFQTATLDTDTPDRNATLVFREGRLLAVLSCLSDIHGDLAGHWYIEATFGDLPGRQPRAFDSLALFEEWLATASGKGDEIDGV
jgi:hypothetical protein